MLVYPSGLRNFYPSRCYFRPSPLQLRAAGIQSSHFGGRGALKEFVPPAAP